MSHIMKKLLISLVILANILTVSCTDNVFKADVVIYGGTSAAVSAAVQTSRMGKSVVLLSPDRHLGGLSSSGLGYTDTGNKEVIGGLAREFYGLIYDHYQKEEAAKVLVEQCLSNMEERLADLDQVIAFYDLQDSILQVMNTTPIDALNEEELDDIINIIEPQKILIVTQAYEKLFSQSTNSLETIGSFSQVIGEGFEGLKYAEENHAAINALKKELTREMFFSGNTYIHKGSMLDVVKTLVSDTHYFLFCGEYSRHVNSLRNLYWQLKEYIPAARSLWQGEMSEEEFWKRDREGWKHNRQ